MNKKKKITSILNDANSLIDIFQFYKKNYPNKKILFKKKMTIGKVIHLKKYIGMFVI